MKQKTFTTEAITTKNQLLNDNNEALDSSTSILQAEKEEAVNATIATTRKNEVVV